MEEKRNITGIILTGGKSTRMGTDKGLVLFNEKPFVEHIIEALKPLADEIILVGNNKEYDSFNLKRVDDLIENAGPLAGLYTGLKHSKTEANLVLSCDVPLISSAVLKQLIAVNEEGFDMVQVQSQDKTMPLIALYKKHCLHSCLRLLNSGERRLRLLANELKYKTIVLESDFEKHTANINTKKELKDINDEFEY